MRLLTLAILVLCTSGESLGQVLYVCGERDGQSSDLGQMADDVYAEKKGLFPKSLRPGQKIRLHFRLPEKTCDLRLTLDLAAGKDYFGFTRDIELSLNQKHLRYVNPVSRGRSGGGRVTIPIASDRAKVGDNVLSLDMRHIRFPSVSYEFDRVELAAGKLTAEEVADIRTTEAARAADRAQASQLLDALRKRLTSSAYLVGTEHALKKVFQDELDLVFAQLQDDARGRFWNARQDRTNGLFPASLLRDEPCIEIAAARHEYETFQLIVVPATCDLRAVRIQARDLAHESGRAIAASNIDLQVVGYVKTKPPRYNIERLGWWPDPLLPYWPFDAYVGQVQPVWVTVYVPPDAAAGEYRGRLVVQPEGQEARTVRMGLKVWDFTLPTEPRLRTAIDLSSGWVSRFYQRHPELNPEGLAPDDIYDNFLREFLKHKLSPFTIGMEFVERKQKPDGTHYYDYSRLDRHLELAMSLGSTGFAAFSTQFGAHGNAIKERAGQEFLVDYYAHLKEKGWFDKAYYYGIDEGYGDIPGTYSLVKRIIPGIRTLTTITHNEKREDYIDIFVPRTCDDWPAYHQRSVPARLRKLGKEYWVYTSGYPVPPLWPQVYVDSPMVDHRVIFWTCAKWGMTGYLKVPVTSWYHMENVRIDYRSVRTPWDVNPGIYGDSNGEILMIYCGPGGKLMSSVRLATLRDGVEDYDYFAILRALLSTAGAEGAPDAAAIDDELLPLPYVFPRRPEVGRLFEKRRQVGQEIERLVAKLGSRALATTSQPKPGDLLWTAAAEPHINNVESRALLLYVFNEENASIKASLALNVPAHWDVRPARSAQVTVGAKQCVKVEFRLQVKDGQRFDTGLTTLPIDVDCGRLGRAAKQVSVHVACYKEALIIGPFKARPSLGMDSKESPLPPEVEIRPTKTYLGMNKKQVRWQRHLIDVQTNLVSFDEIYGTPPTKYVPRDPKENMHGIVYVVTYAHSPTERAVEIALETKNKARLWLNDRLVVGKAKAAADADAPPEGEFGVEDELFGEDEEPVLKKGWNKILFRVQKSTDDWNAKFDLLHPDGKPMYDLMYRAQPAAR